MSMKRTVDAQLGNLSTRKRVKTEEETSKVSYKLIDKEDQVKPAIDKLETSEKLLAVDCEGVNLGRDGSLTVLQISSRDSPCYLFDIQKLEKRPFDLGLKRLLEDKNITKLMFDCKEDSDALAHLFNVYIDGVYDIQLYEMMYREVAPDEEKIQEPRPRRGWHSRLPTRSGMSACIKRYLKTEDHLRSIKDKGRELLSDKTVFEKRPIAKELLEYAAVETQVIFLLFDRFNNRLPLSNHVNRERLEISSDRFVKYFRELPSRTYDKFERNSLMPLNIIPALNVIRGRIDTAVPDGNTKCVGCRKVFSRREFSSNQLKKGVQKCEVCQEVKRLEDVQTNRQKTLELAKAAAAENWIDDVFDDENF